eukprot:CFRG8102T1
MVLELSEVKSLMHSTNAVCFDVDSTVIQHEGIDELADVCGVGEDVAAWTKKAMEGNTLFEDSLKARLALIKPSEKDISKCLERGLGLTNGVRELILKLKKSGKDVYLVSGGFRQMIYPVAAELGIPEDHVYANNILFNEVGEYAGFDSSEPTSRTGGKPKVIEMLIASGLKRVVMIGDGATDMEARPPAILFIGFGEHNRREKVEAGADFFAMDMKTISDLM